VEKLGKPVAPARIGSEHRSTNVIFNGSRSDPPPVLRIQAKEPTHEAVGFQKPVCGADLG
jgi:hypothetical protein